MKNERITPIETPNSKYTFWELLSNYYIEIPIIQRDYAQGRTSERVSQIRDELLDSIYDALTNKNSLDFDFVYGTVDGEKLYPLDGQQRLTTLFLLHWYLAQKEGFISEAKDILKDFSYTTRSSSREFCEMLTDYVYTPVRGISVSSIIKNENGYFRAWDHDPTIKAMLTMLDSIHAEFYDCPPLFAELIDSDSPLISFSFLPMEHYALTDDLYIKMNARGKALTDFENFKAKFIQHLRKYNLPCKHFEDSIDGKWVDLLWDFRSSDNRVDSAFMNLFCYCTEMIFLKTETPRECESPFKPNDIRHLVDYYDSEEKVNYLYSMLDVWTSQEKARDYLESILCSAPQEGKVRVFDCVPDIFSEVVDGSSVSTTNKILLFSIMDRLIRFDNNLKKDDMLDYVRIVRNLLFKNKYFNTSRCSFTADFRFGRNGIPFTRFIIGKLSNSCDPYETIELESCEDHPGINSEIFKQEVAKAELINKRPQLKKRIHRLEDSDLFKGSIFNILELVEDADDDIAEKLEKLFTQENSNLIVRAMMSVADYGIRLGNTSLGDKYFYGSRKHWYEILSYDGGKKHKEFLSYFIDQYLSSEKEYIKDAVQEIIDTHLPLIALNDWRYCIVKYPNTLKDTYCVYNSDLVFVIQRAAQTVLVHRLNGIRLNAYHVVPEYIEVAAILGDKCSPYVDGQNVDNLGGIKLRCNRKMCVCLGEDGSIDIDTDNTELDGRIVVKARELFEEKNHTDMDRVEKLVQIANILLSINSSDNLIQAFIEEESTPDTEPQIVEYGMKIKLHKTPADTILTTEIPPVETERNALQKWALGKKVGDKWFYAGQNYEIVQIER